MRAAGACVILCNIPFCRHHGWAIMAKLDGEFASGSHTGTVRLRHAWRGLFRVTSLNTRSQQITSALPPKGDLGKAG